MMKVYRNQLTGVREILVDRAGANVFYHERSDEVAFNKCCPMRDHTDRNCYESPTDQSAAEPDWHVCDARD